MLTLEFNGQETAIADFFPAAMNGGSFNIEALPTEVGLAIKDLKGKALTQNGFINTAGVISVATPDKARAFIEAKLTELAKKNDFDEDEERTAQVWLKSDDKITEAQRGEDVPMLVRDVVIRRSRKDRKVLYGIGFRGITQEGKGIKFTLGLAYLAMIIKGDKTKVITEDEIKTWGADLKNNWVVLGTLVSIAKKTAYFTFTPNESEKTALDAADITKVRKDNNGAIGFVHQMSGIRYNLAGIADEDESKDFAAVLKNHQLAASERLRTRENEKGRVEGEAYAIQAKLVQLAEMLDLGVITNEEYTAMRSRVITAL
jgi:hypothetical protein